MILSRSSLKNFNGSTVIIPNENVFQLPEKVLQFGTGVLLRGLPDFYINKANNEGIFNGRVVVVKSTGNGDTDDFDNQDGLFTHVIRGIEDGKKVEENIVNASISRVLSAKNQWKDILACAENPAMQIVISNTTEVGIALHAEDKINATPPVSFPGKLLAFLFTRFQFFKGDSTKGMIIIPTELIPQNGKKLQSILVDLARLQSLEPSFIEWIKTDNYFCDSLVDRIVPGKLPLPEKQQIEQEAGFTDNLMIMSEPYSLWAIETDNSLVEEKLSFSKADKGVVITSDISKFRELKLRLLNGTHTFSSGLAFLAGFKTVKEAMEDAAMEGFITQLMQTEISPSIPYKIDSSETTEFSNKVLDRFRNPFMQHHWLAITMQYSSKMKMRNVPVLIEHYRNTSEVPKLMALGFAAHILFMNCREEGGKFYGEINGDKYLVQDDNAHLYAQKWHKFKDELLVNSVLGDKTLWETDLTIFTGFEEAVSGYFQDLRNKDVRQVIKEAQTKK